MGLLNIDSRRRTGIAAMAGNTERWKNDWDIETRPSNPREVPSF